MRFLNSPNRRGRSDRQARRLPPIISRRESWRLWTLAVAMALVILMMRELRQPETVERIETVLTGLSAPNSGQQPEPDAPAVADASRATASNGLARRLLALAGWDSERLASFNDDEPVADEQREELLDLLHRLKSLHGPELAQSSRTGLELPAIVAEPDQFRGELIELAGRVVGLRRSTLPPDQSSRLEMPAYVECRVALDGNLGVATIITARVPDVWFEMDQLNEPAAAAGLFVKRLPVDGAQAAALFVSSEIAWRPHEVREPYVSLGQALLGSLGMDVGLLDMVRHRKSIESVEREAFYQLLRAAGRAGAKQLVRAAEDDLPALADRWTAESQRLRALADQTESPVDKTDIMRLRLADEVIERADGGRYSVAPLFNDPASQVGRLVTLDGVARRAMRIDVGTTPDGTPSDVQRRFGIDHYFELDLFTDDSQNNPVVFCVSQLPAGFPQGESIREPVRVAGFFFKSWRYRSRRVSEGGPNGGAAIAPLLIGRGPLWIQTPPAAADGVSEWLLGGLFVVAVAAIWGAIWWFGRGLRSQGGRPLPERLPLEDLD